MLDRVVRIKQSRLYIAETMIGLMLLTTINVIFMPLRPAFYGFNPNPYWIVILAIAARYGRKGGIFAGICASVFFLTYHIIIDGSISIFVDEPTLLAYPFLFFLVGFLIGEVKTVFLLREDFLTRRVEELESRGDQVKKEYDILKYAHKDLTTNVATSQETLTTLSQISKRLKSFSPNDIYMGILECFNKYIGAEECSIYLKEGDELVLEHKLGWKDYYKRPEKIKIGSGLVGMSAETKRTLTIKDAIFGKKDKGLPDSDMLGDTVLSVPILDLEGEPYGVVNIEKIEFLKLTEDTIQKTRIICDLAASALNNAYTFEAIEREQIKERGYDLYKYHYFISRVNEEYTRSINYMLPLSVMGFHWPIVNTLEEAKKRPFLESVITIIKGRLRAFDVLATGPDNETPLVLLLATTPGPQAEELKKRIVEKFREYNLNEIISKERDTTETIAVGDFNPRKISNVKEFLAQIGIVE